LLDAMFYITCTQLNVQYYPGASIEIRRTDVLIDCSNYYLDIDGKIILEWILGK